jgi:hypothetical protein
MERKRDYVSLENGQWLLRENKLPTEEQALLIALRKAESLTAAPDLRTILRATCHGTFKFNSTLRRR